jgi:hypothetical protein
MIAGLIMFIQKSWHITAAQVAIVWALIMLIVFCRQNGLKNTILVIVMMVVLYGLAFAVGRLFFR